MSLAGLGNYHLSNEIMDRWVYLNILKLRQHSSAQKLDIGNNFYFQPKHTARVVGLEGMAAI